jgi:hypothetical protein
VTHSGQRGIQGGAGRISPIPSADALKSWSTTFTMTVAVFERSGRD